MTEHAHDGFVDWMRAIHPWGVLFGVLGCRLRPVLGFGWFLWVAFFGRLPLGWGVRGAGDVGALGRLGVIAGLLRVRRGVDAGGVH